MVLHSCHRGHLGCVAPTHLSLGTHADNMRQMSLSGNAEQKLSKDDVIEIKQLLDQGILSLQDIGNLYCVTRQTIWDIKHHPRAFLSDSSDLSS